MMDIRLSSQANGISATGGDERIVGSAGGEVVCLLSVALVSSIVTCNEHVLDDESAFQSITVPKEIVAEVTKSTLNVKSVQVLRGYAIED